VGEDRENSRRGEAVPMPDSPRSLGKERRDERVGEV